MSLFFLQRTDDLGEVLVGTFTTRELAEEHIINVESKALLEKLNLHESMLPSLLSGKFPEEEIARAQEFMSKPAPADPALALVHGLVGQHLRNIQMTRPASSLPVMRAAHAAASMAFKMSLAECRKKYRIEAVG